MKKLYRALALIMAVCMLCCFPVQASAEGATIDYTQTASLSLYKYDLTKAEADGAWDTSAYVSTGLYDQSVNDAMSNYAVPGVEFTHLRIADIAAYNADENGEHKVITLYGFTDTAFLTAIGLGTGDAHHTENGVSYLSYMDDTPDCILELICDVLCSKSPGIKIGGESIPTAKVQSRFRRLRFEHVSYVLDSLEKTTTEIKDIRAYLLTALYNAPLTIGPYYSAAVRHDSMRQ